VAIPNRLYPQKNASTPNGLPIAKAAREIKTVTAPKPADDAASPLFNAKTSDSKAITLATKPKKSENIAKTNTTDFTN
jgi:hypothetical protein